ncbi:hypothetical protein IM660_09360 [Ruania alkalisoli]|uniref:Uncharacterized protein n=1 Tax=Ruania alkalisoli TaxID=2779775 RepID=A0A7M1T097_9MICO|nr:hypothetical protein [Ruania alkalisoli]QOR72402.1 hypothetical protein IM660_09360 [Ruania alkalisoli]
MADPSAAPQPLPRGWRTRTGPRRRAYLGPFAGYVLILVAVFGWAYEVQAGRDAAAADLQRSTTEALTLNVAESGEWSVYLDTYAGVEQSDALAQALAGDGGFGVEIVPGDGAETIALQRPTGGTYRLDAETDLIGHGIADVELTPGEYRLSVATAADPPESAIAGFSAGLAPDAPPVLVLLAAIGGAAAMLVWALIIRSGRRRAARRLLRPVLGHGRSA